jgi:hypothetical protein
VLEYSYSYLNKRVFTSEMKNRPYKKRIYHSNIWTHVEPGLTAEIQLSED